MEYQLGLRGSLQTSPYGLSQAQVELTQTRSSLVPLALPRRVH